MASSSLDNFILLLCTDHNSIEPNITDGKILISTEDIHSWDLHNILRYRTVEVQALRNRLIEGSSYFHGLLSGSFSEACLDRISIQWNLQTFLNVLKCIYDCKLDVTSDNFLSLFEGSLYFGVERLLLKCKTWFSEATSSTGLLHIELDDLIHVWNFGLEHANDFVPELCASYLARNFMWAVSSKYFQDLPYNLLLLCIKHPDLTVESEMHLLGALLTWRKANTKQLECSSRAQDAFADILEKIRFSLLPIRFAAGQRRSHCLSSLANKTIDSIVRLTRTPTGLINLLVDCDLDHFRIRLTEYSKKLNLSGCPQITSAILFLSVLPSYSMDPTLKNSIKRLLINLERVDEGQNQIHKSLHLTLHFEAVQEINISRCSRLNIEAAIECFSKSFPLLRTLKAAYLLNFKITSLCKLMEKCPLVSEVDLTVDISPVILAQVSVVSSSLARTQPLSMPSLSVGINSLTSTLLDTSGQSLSSITILNLEGRSDLSDSDLLLISKLCLSLQQLNIKGCTSVTDICISYLIQRCVKLRSVVLCDTSFGMSSVLALCTGLATSDFSTASSLGKKTMNSLASNLQTLHMGGCKGVDEASLLELMSQTQKLKSLCLRDTHLVDIALYNFSGSSLEMLDVSNTMISGAAVAHLAHRNPALKCLKARGCRNLHPQKNTERAKFSSSHVFSELITELGRTCKLEEITIGWGFAYSSIEALNSAIMPLRAIAVGLGGSLGEDALKLLPNLCPLLESLILHFQVISDSIMTNIMKSLKHLQIMALCFCFGDISLSSFSFSLPNLRKLRLERVTPWMTNDDLFVLAQNCVNLIEISLLGCMLLDSADSILAEAQQIISSGWPGMISLHLEDCGEVTANGVCALFDCIALEELLLRHNGPGICKNFIFDAASKMPMLRQISLDLCDAREGDFDIPDFDSRCFLSSVKIARCKSQRCALSFQQVEKAQGKPLHKETLVLAWSSRNLARTVVKERL